MPPATPSDSPALFVGSFVGFGWETFKKRPWFLIGTTLLFSVIGWIASAAVAIVSEILGEIVGTGLAALVSFIANFVVNSLIAMGWIAFFIKAHDDIATVTISRFWHPQNLLNYIAVTILFGLIVFVGFVLLIVPGVIAATALLFAPYLVVDKGLGPIAALKESARITKGNRLRVLALMGALALISILGFLALIVGLLVAVPVTAIAYVSAYRRLSAAADAAAARVPLSGGEIALMIAGLIVPILLIIVGILSSVVLASLNSAREKGRAAQAEVNLKMMQLSLELYGSEFNSYPPALSEMSADVLPVSVDTSDFSYTQLEGGRSYRLCSNEPVYSGTDCVTPEPLDTSETVQ